MFSISFREFRLPFSCLDGVGLVFIVVSLIFHSFLLCYFLFTFGILFVVLNQAEVWLLAVRCRCLLSNFVISISLITKRFSHSIRFVPFCF